MKTPKCGFFPKAGIRKKDLNQSQSSSSASSASSYCINYYRPLALAAEPTSINNLIPLDSEDWPLVTMLSKRRRPMLPKAMTLRAKRVLWVMVLTVCPAWWIRLRLKEKFWILITCGLRVVGRGNQLSVPPKDCFTFFSQFLDWGLRFPMNSFMCWCLIRWNLVPSSWSRIVIRPSPAVSFCGGGTTCWTSL